MMQPESHWSEVSSTHDGRANFPILMTCDPHVLEHRERAQDGGTYPGTVLGIWRDAHLEGGEGNPYPTPLWTDQNTIQ